MAIKIVKTNNALVITDTVTSKTLVDVPANRVYYKVEVLEEQNTIRLVNIDNNDKVHDHFADYPISANVVDTGDTPYTDASWKTFARTNLG